MRILAALLLIGGNVPAGGFHVHYSIRGNGRDITVRLKVRLKLAGQSWRCFPARW
jgi:hypothetical protein